MSLYPTFEKAYFLRAKLPRPSHPPTASPQTSARKFKNVSRNPRKTKRERLPDEDIDCESTSSEDTLFDRHLVGSSRSNKEGDNDVSCSSKSPMKRRRVDRDADSNQDKDKHGREESWREVLQVKDEINWAGDSDLSSISSDEPFVEERQAEQDNDLPCQGPAEASPTLSIAPRLKGVEAPLPLPAIVVTVPTNVDTPVDVVRVPRTGHEGLSTSNIPSDEDINNATTARSIYTPNAPSQDRGTILQIDQEASILDEADLTPPVSEQVESRSILPQPDLTRRGGIPGSNLTHEPPSAHRDLPVADILQDSREKSLPLKQFHISNIFGSSAVRLFGNSFAPCKDDCPVTTKIINVPLRRVKLTLFTPTNRVETLTSTPKSSPTSELKSKIALSRPPYRFWKISPVPEEKPGQVQAAHDGLEDEPKNQSQTRSEAQNSCVPASPSRPLALTSAAHQMAIQTDHIATILAAEMVEDDPEILQAARILTNFRRLHSALNTWVDQRIAEIRWSQSSNFISTQRKKTVKKNPPRRKRVISKRAEKAGSSRTIHGVDEGLKSSLKITLPSCSASSKKVQRQGQGQAQLRSRSRVRFADLEETDDESPAWKRDLFSSSSISTTPIPNIPRSPVVLSLDSSSGSTQSTPA
ncbi:hypothetical protein IAR55_005465 [Kwoniella newhampshirensis]|uniref:Uncharacterized protein n=1 Tax=Kwoniella newhampshirensis TaxID=1651941 RepID=A0AAW0YVX5_9TREE